VILEILDGRATLDGRPLDHAARNYLVPRGSHEYSLEPDRHLVREDEQYLHLDAARSTLVINTSWYGERPLFYHAGSRYFVVSSSFELLLASVHRQQGTALALDRVGILESMIFDNPLRSRTLFKDVRKITTGKRLTLDWTTSELSEQTVFVLPFDGGSSTAKASALLEEAVGILSGLIPDDLLRDGTVLLPLSGGLDSRLLACLLKERRVPYEAMTFGPRESTEPYIAKQVAKRLGVSIRHLDLKDEYYKPFGDTVTWRTGGLSNHRHCHLYSCLSANGISPDYLVHGFLGDVYSGGSQPGSAARYDMSRDAALGGYLSRHVEKTWLWRHMSTADRDGIVDDLTAILEENCLRNLPCHFHEYVHSVDRQFSLIANVFSPVEELTTVVRPFASRAYAEFFNSLPHGYRAGRRLYREACSAMFPSVFAIGNQDQVFNNRFHSGRLESGVSALIAMISYASLLCTNGQRVIRNPKGFERHRELLCTTLHDDFVEATAAVSGLLNMDLRRLCALHVRNRDELSSQYRVLSLHALMRQLDAHGIDLGGGCT